MYSIFIGSLLMSLLHAVIPNHRLPVPAIGRKENWSMQEVTRVTFLSGPAHALSTISIGIILGLLGYQLSASLEYFTHYIAPVFLILLGLFFIYRNHRHCHFHLHNIHKPALSKNKIIMSLVIVMFLSPCMGIEAYFLPARRTRRKRLSFYCSYASAYNRYRNGALGKVCIQRHF